MTRTAEIRVKAKDGVFVADRCEVRGGWVEAQGRWRWTHGPEYQLERYSVPRSYTWPRSEIAEIRWMCEAVAA